MSSCPMIEARKILDPSMNLSSISCSNIGRMHQVEAAPLLAWKVFSGTSVVRRRVVAMPTEENLYLSGRH